ncbi:MBL fold metallo-hydrolase [Chitinophaga sp. CF418]|uniref:MBL fold metallo-hydrolase n=1 Tax=Chitinophaga sp. CF418 TaxID=1855287 RepID=UPI0009249203|nr:MBL fold metallo-hydrolase [Chitinophaga sp. CF418]SHN35953.1 Glyoxylase, beta-lactamase superfamily II [Chitinophaga sp. CF418]
MKQYSFTTALLILCISAIIPATAQSLIQQPGHYAINFGTHRIIALSDGIFPAPAFSLLKDADSADVAGSLHHAFLPDTVETSINCYLIVSGKRLILVDAGCGTQLGNNSGKLLMNMKAAGYEPAQVTDIIITHLHIDHASGISEGEKPLFPNAKIYVNSKDLNFWKSHATPDKNEHWGITLNRPAYKALQPYISKGKVVGFGDGEEILPDLTAYDYSGHTSGHTVFMLRSGNKQLVFWGDLIHIAAVQLVHPEMAVEFDLDKLQAIAQRRRALEEAAKTEYLIAAAHIGFPGIGRIRRNDLEYRWYPVSYSPTGNDR